MATVDQTRTGVVPQAQRRRAFQLTPYLFILPHLIFFSAFLAWPFFYGIYISFFSFDFLRPEYRPFVGLENYANILINRNSIQFHDFWRAMGNTGWFLLYSVPPLVGLALVLAVLLNGHYPGRNVFRAIYFAPYTLSVTVAAVLWRWIFEQGGLVNYYMRELGLTPIAWLGSIPWAWVAITIATVWWTVGFNTVIFLAALQEIPDTLYEAAAIDGANALQQFVYVTLPMLRPVLVFVITITLIASANLFGQPYIMTEKGGPVQQTEPVMLRIFIEGIGFNRMGSAAAMSIVVAALLLLLTTLNFRIFGRAGER
ncbi:carbohydrate ABC transporter permease [Kallotenue papyrolyticum]|uniref:carbohydrate ABC transporter permease n=1 Tax=Kallotenue papyrolyticum TaxID=1325125 RepID=UPI000492AC03|nr:sugar ABC transporter permease [Kallotenue papyrolyticum]